MHRLKRFFHRHALPAAIAITAVLLACVVIANLILYFTRLLPLTGGTACLELNFGHLPADLFAFAEAYGEEGRRLYIAMSSTLDMATPFLAAVLVEWLVFYAGKRVGAEPQRRQGAALALGACGCLSDWAENACMICILASYPAQPMAVAVLARIFTSLKYLFMVVLAIVLVLQLRCWRR